MNVTMQIVPVRNTPLTKPSYQLSIAETDALNGATGSVNFESMTALTIALLGIGFDLASVRFAEKTLSSGMNFTRPGVKLWLDDLQKLGIQQMRRQSDRGRER